MREAVVMPAPAKVNLRLVVHAREETGYHQLETIFQALSLSDRLRIERGGAGISLEVQGAELGAPEENLAYRAAEAFYAEAELEPAASIAIEKRIPVGSGLGGGSSDAAVTLRALNRLYGEPLRRERLLDLGAALGADVPFFLTPTPLALGWGRGERLLSLPPLGSAPVLIAVAGPEIATGDAYAMLGARGELPLSRDRGHDIPVDALRDWEGIAGYARNDFEDVIFGEHPQLAKIREAFGETESRLALLSGSGSAVFAVYRGEGRLEEAHESLSHRFPGTVFMPAQTLTAMPPVSVE